MGPIPILVMVALCAMQPVDGKMPLHTKPEKYRIPGQYIIVLKDDVDVNSFASAFEASVLRGTSDGKIKHKYQHTIKGFSARLSSDTVDKLRQSEHVKYIEEDGIVHALAVSSWGLDRVDQRGLPLDGNTPEFIGDGTNTHLYIIDSGTLYTHEEFSGRTGNGVDIIGNQVGIDCHGHGTHCGGTAGGTNYGIASKATIHSVRVLGCDGSGTSSDVIEGYEWVAANRITPAVASISLGGGHSPTENQVVQKMINEGVVVSVAAGNEDQDACNTSPASAPEAITVGATDINDKRASFSNYGGCVDIFAPGVGITSSYIAGGADPNSISNTVTWDGTSMACPHVSGAAAALLSVDGSLTPAQVTDQLLSASTVNQVTDPKSSPNRLLYIGRTLSPPPAPSSIPGPTSCNLEVDSTGQVTSPNYPGYYNDMTCDTIIDAGDKVVSLNFLDFEVEDEYDCSYDSLSIYDGSDTDSDLIGVFCGAYVPPTVFSTGQYMLLVFKSDYSETYAGFRADVDFVSGPTSCNSEVDSMGQVTSPNYPGYYNNDMTCNTIINAGAGKVVSLNFLDFEVEYEDYCSYDSLSIYDADRDLIGVYCGAYLPHPVYSTGQYMLLVFKSDSSETYAGFRADVDFVSDWTTMLKPTRIIPQKVFDEPDFKTMVKPTRIIPQKVFDEPDFKTMLKPTRIIPQKVFDEPDAEKSMKPTRLVPQLSGDPGKNEENISEKDVTNGSN